MKQALILLIALVLSACPQTESTSVSIQQPSSQSAIDVKTQNTTISFHSLGESKPLVEAPSNVPSVAHLFAKKASNAQVEDSGEVVKVLADDINGSRHQRFLVRIASGQTLLFAHNIDLAPRINDIKVGDVVSFRGEYEYNPKGGIIHWTHHDPQGQHDAGWIKHNGKTYD
ncbi:MAG TPA: DUF3465 domain-containing protein [Methylotenera sp.]|nr:DUF3465 domain-containing protein [Methylotenera sp.]